MSPEETIEQLARKLYRVPSPDDEESDDEVPEWDELFQNWKDYYLALAEVVLATPPSKLDAAREEMHVWARDLAALRDAGASSDSGAVRAAHKHFSEASQKYLDAIEAE